MQKRIFVITLTIITLCVSLTSAVTGPGKIISNQINSSTYLQSPIRLTKVGDLPSQVVADQNYSMHIVIENLADRLITGGITIQISTGYYVEPMIISNSSVTSSRGGVTIFPYNYSQLTPDMITIRWNDTIWNGILSSNSTANGIVAHTPPIILPAGYYGDAKLTLTFNDSAPTDTNYYLSVWYEQYPIGTPAGT